MFRYLEMFGKRYQNKMHLPLSSVSFYLRMFLLFLFPLLNLVFTSEVAKSGTDEYCSGTPSSVSAACVIPQKQTLCRLSERHESNEEELDGSLPETERDDMMFRRMGAFQRHSSPIRMHSPPTSMGHHSLQQQKKVAHKEDLKTLQKAERSENESQQL